MFLKKSIFRSTQPVCTRGGRTKDCFTRLKRHIGPSDAVLVAYELCITELKIQRIVRVWGGTRQPTYTPHEQECASSQLEIVKKSLAHSKKEISLRNNELLVFSNVLLLPRHSVSQDVLDHAKSCGFRGKLTAARLHVDPIQSSMEYRIEPCCKQNEDCLFRRCAGEANLRCP